MLPVMKLFDITAAIRLPPRLHDRAFVKYL